MFPCILHHLLVYYEPQYNQLPVGLIGQLVELCTGIAEVMGSNLPRYNAVKYGRHHKILAPNVMVQVVQFWVRVLDFYFNF